MSAAMSERSDPVLSAAGTPFCPKCGSILVLPDYDPIKCHICSFHTSYTQLHIPVGIAAARVAVTLTPGTREACNAPVYVTNSRPGGL